jgi:hypothetical protein
MTHPIRKVAILCAGVMGAAIAAWPTERSAAERRGIQPLARFVGFAVDGVRPAIMGIAPVVAIPKVLRRSGLSLDAIDLIALIPEQPVVACSSGVSPCRIDRTRMVDTTLRPRVTVQPGQELRRSSAGGTSAGMRVPATLAVPG